MSQALEFQRSDRLLPRVAFVSSMIFLTILAASIHWLEAPLLGPETWRVVLPALWLAMLGLTLYEYLRSGTRTRRALLTLLLVALAPPFRLGVCPGHPGHIWLPTLGWQPYSQALFRLLERSFATPMLIVAGLMLPIVAIDIFLPQVARIPWVQEAMILATGAIWMAFTIEFIIMISVTEAKLKYCLSHWLDLVIILLPLISYLRALRLVKLGRVARTIRAYRLRSLTTKVFRGATTADLIGRLLRRSPEQRISHLRAQQQHHQEEIEELERRIAALTKQIPEPD